MLKNTENNSKRHKVNRVDELSEVYIAQGEAASVLGNCLDAAGASDAANDSSCRWRASAT